MWSVFGMVGRHEKHGELRVIQGGSQSGRVQVPPDGWAALLAEGRGETPEVNAFRHVVRCATASTVEFATAAFRNALISSPNPSVQQMGYDSVFFPVGHERLTTRYPDTSGPFPVYARWGAIGMGPGSDIAWLRDTPPYGREREKNHIGGLYVAHDLAMGGLSVVEVHSQRGENPDAPYLACLHEGDEAEMLFDALSVAARTLHPKQALTETHLRLS